MTWRVRFDGIEFTDDQMTLEELGAYEDFTGESWLIANPVSSVKAAKAFLTVALLRAGRSDDEVTQRLSELTREQLKGVFAFEPDPAAVEAMKRAEGGDDVAPLARSNGSSAGSSRGGSAGSGGPRRKRARSA